MKIAVDIRSLLEPYMSGVGEYTYNVLKRILETDHENQYHLFYNIRHSVKTEPPEFDYSNVKILGYRYPNRWLNLLMRFLGWPRIEKLAGLNSLPPCAPPSLDFARDRLAGGDISRDISSHSDVMWFPNFGFMNYNIKVPYVLTVHDLSFERYPGFFTPVHRLWHKLIDCQRMARGAAKVIAVSENTKRDLIELYEVDEGKIEVIHEGIDAKLRKECETTKMRKVAEKYKLPEKYVLFLGTIEPRKNIEAIIRAFDKYANGYANECESDSNIHLVLAGGPGWRNEEIYKIYEQARNKDRIKFIGYVDKEDKPVLYSLASLFVFPSIYEGFGLPPLEAMACGTPVIVSAASSLPEVVGSAGLLVDSYNINELAEGMRAILSDERLRNDFIEKGYERIKKFDWGECAEKTLEVIKGVGELS